LEKSWRAQFNYLRVLREGERTRFLGKLWLRVRVVNQEVWGAYWSHAFFLRCCYYSTASEYTWVVISRTFNCPYIRSRNFVLNFLLLFSIGLAATIFVSKVIILVIPSSVTKVQRILWVSTKGNNNFFVSVKKWRWKETRVCIYSHTVR